MCRFPFVPATAGIQAQKDSEAAAWIPGIGERSDTVFDGYVRE